MVAVAIAGCSCRWSCGILLQLGCSCHPAEASSALQVSQICPPALSLWWDIVDLSQGVHSMPLQRVWNSKFPSFPLLPGVPRLLAVCQHVRDSWCGFILFPIWALSSVYLCVCLSTNFRSISVLRPLGLKCSRSSWMLKYKCFQEQVAQNHWRKTQDGLQNTLN